MRRRNNQRHATHQTHSSWNTNPIPHGFVAEFARAGTRGGAEFPIFLSLEHRAPHYALLVLVEVVSHRALAEELTASRCPLVPGFAHAPFQTVQSVCTAQLFVRAIFHDARHFTG